MSGERSATPARARPPRDGGRSPRAERDAPSGQSDRQRYPGGARSAGSGGADARRPDLADRPYDPRREARRQLVRLPVPDGVDPRDLDPEVRADLRSLAKDTADLAAQHLVMTGRLLDDEPAAALAHARAAGALAGRIGAVREAVGLAAYAAEEWSEALSELRTARRITGRADHLAVLADCERALGRPERALAVLDDPDVPLLEQSVRVELVIVVAGARRDLGQHDAAVLLLQGPARATTARRPWATRLWYAYADALLAAAREDEAREWFAKAAEQDGQGETDALDRLLELDGVVLEDLQSDEDDDAEEPEGEPVDLQALLAAPVAARPTGDSDSGDDGAGDPAVGDRAVAHEAVRDEAVNASGAAPADSATLPPAPAVVGGGPGFSDEEDGHVGGQTPVATAPRPAPAVPFAPPREDTPGP